MLANGTEEAKEVWLDADSTKVADEKVDPGSRSSPKFAVN
jgi:hypothetical protein